MRVSHLTHTASQPQPQSQVSCPPREFEGKGKPFESHVGSAKFMPF